MRTEPTIHAQASDRQPIGRRANGSGTRSGTPARGRFLSITASVVANAWLDQLTALATAKTGDAQSWNSDRVAQRYTVLTWFVSSSVQIFHAATPMALVLARRLLIKTTRRRTRDASASQARGIELRPGIEIMTKASVGTNWQRSIIVLTVTVVSVVAITILYWAQSIFIPVALAAFLTFLLSPLVSWLRQRGVGRTPAVIMTVCLAALGLGIVGWVVTAQISSLLRELPKYSQNVKAKVKSLKRVAAGSNRLTKMIVDINHELGSQPTPRADAPGDDQRTAIKKPKRRSRPPSSSNRKARSGFHGSRHSWRR